MIIQQFDNDKEMVPNTGALGDQSGRSILELLAVIVVIVLLTLVGLMGFRFLAAKVQVYNTSKMIATLVKERKHQVMTSQGSNKNTQNVNGPNGVLKVENGTFEDNGQDQKDFFWVTLTASSKEFCEGLKSSDLIQADTYTVNGYVNGICEDNVEMIFYYKKGDKGKLSTGNDGKLCMGSVTCNSGAANKDDKGCPITKISCTEGISYCQDDSCVSCGTPSDESCADPEPDENGCPTTKKISCKSGETCSNGSCECNQASVSVCDQNLEDNASCPKKTYSSCLIGHCLADGKTCGECDYTGDCSGNQYCNPSTHTCKNCPSATDNCKILADRTDSNGCIILKKITCSGATPVCTSEGTCVSCASQYSNSSEVVREGFQIPDTSCYCVDGYEWDVTQSKCVQGSSQDDFCTNNYPGTQPEGTILNGVTYSADCQGEANTPVCCCPEGQKWWGSSFGCSNCNPSVPMPSFGEGCTQECGCASGTGLECDSNNACHCLAGQYWNGSSCVGICSNHPDTAPEGTEGYTGGLADKGVDETTDCYCQTGKMWQSSSNSCIEDPDFYCPPNSSSKTRTFPGSGRDYKVPEKFGIDDCYCNECYEGNSDAVRENEICTPVTPSTEGSTCTVDCECDAEKDLFCSNQSNKCACASGTNWVQTYISGEEKGERCCPTPSSTVTVCGYTGVNAAVYQNEDDYVHHAVTAVYDQTTGCPIYNVVVGTCPDGQTCGEDRICTETSGGGSDDECPDNRLYCTDSPSGKIGTIGPEFDSTYHECIDSLLCCDHDLDYLDGTLFGCCPNSKYTIKNGHYECFTGCSAGETEYQKYDGYPEYSCCPGGESPVCEDYDYNGCINRICCPNTRPTIKESCNKSCGCASGTGLECDQNNKCYCPVGQVWYNGACVGVCSNHPNTSHILTDEYQDTNGLSGVYGTQCWYTNGYNNDKYYSPVAGGSYVCGDTGAYCYCPIGMTANSSDTACIDICPDGTKPEGTEGYTGGSAGNGLDGKTECYCLADQYWNGSSCVDICANYSGTYPTEACDNEWSANLMGADNSNQCCCPYGRSWEGGSCVNVCSSYLGTALSGTNGYNGAYAGRAIVNGEECWDANCLCLCRTGQTWDESQSKCVGGSDDDEYPETPVGGCTNQSDCGDGYYCNEGSCSRCEFGITGPLDSYEACTKCGLGHEGIGNGKYTCKGQCPTVSVCDGWKWWNDGFTCGTYTNCFIDQGSVITYCGDLGGVNDYFTLGGNYPACTLNVKGNLYTQASTDVTLGNLNVDGLLWVNNGSFDFKGSVDVEGDSYIYGDVTVESTVGGYFSGGNMLGVYGSLTSTNLDVKDDLLVYDNAKLFASGSVKVGDLLTVNSGGFLGTKAIENGTVIESSLLDGDLTAYRITNSGTIRKYQITVNGMTKINSSGVLQACTLTKGETVQNSGKIYSLKYQNSDSSTNYFVNPGGIYGVTPYTNCPDMSIYTGAAGVSEIKNGQCVPIICDYNSSDNNARCDSSSALIGYSSTICSNEETCEENYFGTGQWVVCPIGSECHTTYTGSISGHPFCHCNAGKTWNGTICE